MSEKGFPLKAINSIGKTLRSHSTRRKYISAFKCLLQMIGQHVAYWDITFHGVASETHLTDYFLSAATIQSNQIAVIYHTNSFSSR